MMRNHNKSGKPTLSLLSMDDATLELHYKTLCESDLVQVTAGTIEDSDCHIYSSTDGRISSHSKKIFWAYQLIAWKKFGRAALDTVPSNKRKEDLVISHLCGNGPRCCNPEHLVLETKETNEQRIHCHYCIKNIFAHSEFIGTKIALDLGLCPHTPTCCTKHTITEL